MNKFSLPASNQRIELDLTGFGLPEVPLFGIHHQGQAATGLLPHTHPGLMEICYLRRGERVYHVKDQDYPFRGNEVFITFPDEVHGSGANLHGKGLLYWTQLRLPKRPQAFLGLTSREAAPLIKQLKQLPRRQFRGEVKLQHIFERIFTICREPEQPLRRLKISTLLIDWLLTIIRCAQAPAPAVINQDIQRALELIAAATDTFIPLPRLARSVGLSASHFKAKFKRQLGLPPGEYVLRHKIELARQRLQNSRHSVTEVAYELGFSSSQYFATVFKRFTRMRPSQLLRNGKT